MSRYQKTALGIGAGLIWTVVLLWIAVRFVQLPVFALMPTIMSAFLAPGLVMLAIVAVVSLRRFSNDAALSGGPLTAAGEIDRRVLQNTTEQLVLALCLWPAAAVILGGAGPGLILCLGWAFALARLAYWLGYHHSVVLKAFGFSATLFPTVASALWALWQLAFGFA